ncbi:MAG TPA: hypothetical protein DEB30_03700 [Candidatus Peribacter riflensis]|nr:MAG: hypothetical protein A2398_04965 [Candidatus Peribacteria bacterium RIFOXYB1_FULL_57_12]OGJ80205.1 MAG: hypothetical protein A2412_04620 [Candidatus Peribacteria bacterium RIFOXYC1_FULL_58_8]HBH19924.1 hypothetical protein [Candidatus Peribacter riflensis]HBU09873.1 hypothetical protein [Candidatus Peribacter riflensis]
MSHRHITHRLDLFCAVLSAVLLPAATACAQSFTLDFDSLQAGAAEQRSDAYILEGGLVSLQAAGEAEHRQTQPVGAVSFCGNNVQENGEECDGTDRAGVTCASLGFTQGDVLCTVTCTLESSACTNNEAGTTATAGNSALGKTGGGGRGRNAPAAAPSAVQAAPASPTPAPSPETPSRHASPVALVAETAPTMAALPPSIETAEGFLAATVPDTAVLPLAPSQKQAAALVFPEQRNPAEPAPEPDPPMLSRLTASLLSWKLPGVTYAWGGLIFAGIVSMLFFFPAPKTAKGKARRTSSRRHS